jgi:hypothetical protein
MSHLADLLPIVRHVRCRRMNGPAQDAAEGLSLTQSGSRAPGGIAHRSGLSAIYVMGVVVILGEIFGPPFATPWRPMVDECEIQECQDGE